MQLQDNSMNKILTEIVIGAVFMIPLLILKTVGVSGKVPIVLTKVLFSIGIIIVLTKVMSFIARIILGISSEVIFSVLYIILETVAVCIFIAFNFVFEIGYLWLEIVTFIIYSIWLLIDMNTIKCIKKVNEIYNNLNRKVDSHSDEVSSFEIAISEISEKKDKLLSELETYIKKPLLKDPLKNIRQEISFPDMYRYLDNVPQYRGNYTGLSGLFHGMNSVRRFQYSVDKYESNLAQERKSLNDELSMYQEIVDILEKKIKLIKQSDKNIYSLCDLGFDTSQFETIYQNDIYDAQNCNDDFKDANKVHKKMNKIRRRRKYGK